MAEELTEQYLRRRGFDVQHCRELGGGVSNIVLWVQTPSEQLVFKQSLARLRVRDEWLFDQRRIVNERRCMEWIGTVMPAAAPRVRFADDENFIFGMTAVPPGGRLWKESLLQGETDRNTAWRMGEMLRRFHTLARSDERARQTFSGQDVFLQGRVDPYHRFTARRHPDLAPWIEAEVARLLAHQETLVHGDYSPKNLFAYPEQVMMLDFEVAHWGDPAFDVAFCLTHLILKVIHFPARRADYLGVAEAFWNGYGPAVETEVNTLRELGCLLLARIDGKSKEDYIQLEDEREEARALARWLLTKPPESIAAVWRRLT